MRGIVTWGSIIAAAGIVLPACINSPNSLHNHDVFPDHYKRAFSELESEDVSENILKKAFSGDQESILVIIHRSDDKSLDGEYAEHHAYILLKILLSVGDENFADILKRVSPATQQATGTYLNFLINAHDLHFPKTKSLLNGEARG